MWFLSMNTTLFKKLLRSKADILINFSSQYPIFYKKNVIQSIFSLESLSYPELNQIKFSEKYKNAFVLKSNLENATKIITLNEKLKKDLNEKLNIEEEKIEIIPGFFTQKTLEKQVSIDIKAKYVLQNNYIIYDQWVGVSKNIKRFLQAIKEVQKEIPLHVLFLGNTLSNHLETRQEIISLGIEKKCIFVWHPAENELQSYYSQSIGVFFPHLYDNFPACVETALHFQTPIFISKWYETQLVLWDQAHYFSPLDSSSIQDSLLQANSGVGKIQSKEILKKYDISNFAKHIFDTYTSIL